MQKTGIFDNPELRAILSYGRKSGGGTSGGIVPDGTLEIREAGVHSVVKPGGGVYADVDTDVLTESTYNARMAIDGGSSIECDITVIRCNTGQYERNEHSDYKYFEAVINSVTRTNVVSNFTANVSMSSDDEMSVDEYTERNIGSTVVTSKTDTISGTDIQYYISRSTSSGGRSNAKFAVNYGQDGGADVSGRDGTDFPYRIDLSAGIIANVTHASLALLVRHDTTITINGEPIEKMSISENGTYGVSGYDTVTVDVPLDALLPEEGSEDATLTVTENGTYDVSGKRTVVVIVGKDETEETDPPATDGPGVEPSKPIPPPPPPITDTDDTDHTDTDPVVYG